MIKLYIDNKLVDVDETIDIKITYQSTDLENPTAIKNSFSKSIDLKGTPINNDVFGNIFKLDFSTVEGDGHSGINFDARKRTPFELYNNGEAVECGYMQMNSIKINDGAVTYNITLYGMLGDFMYNLMYNEDGTQKTLADIYYHFKDEDGNTYSASDEKNKYIIKWDKDFVKEGWDKLKSDDYADMRPSTFIKATPTYSGLYDDFDNDKFLVNFNSLDESTIENLFPIAQQGVGEGGYILATSQREMDEWECRDLRSIYQRPCVKLSFIMNAIVNSNSEYTVEWDKDILNSPYFNNTWICFDRLNFDDDAEVQNELSPISSWYKGGMQSTFLADNGVIAIDTSEMQNPYADLHYYISTLSPTNDVFATSYLTATEDLYGYKPTYGNKVVGGYITKVNIYDGDTVVGGTNWQFVTTGWNGLLLAKLDDYFPEYLDKVAAYTHIPKSEISVQYVGHKYNEEEQRYEFFAPIDFKAQLPKTTQCKIEIVIQKVCIDEDGNETDFARIVLPHSVRDTNLQFDGSWFFGYNGSFTITQLYGIPIKTNGAILTTPKSSCYDGDFNPSVQRMNVNKSILFGNKATPFDYLTSFTKLFNLRYETDIPNKKIQIKTRKNYYIDEVVDINQAIDRKSITIKPTTINSKYYSYKLDDGGTYAAYLYNKKNDNTYAEYRMSTAFDFNRNVTNIFDGNVYSCTIPYQQSSIFYNNIDGYYPFTLAPTYTYNKYTGIDYESEEITANGYSATNRLYSTSDTMPKVCLFDADNANASDIKHCILFFDGFAEYDAQVSDNNEYMYILNENPCHLITEDEDEVIKVDEIPIFWNYLSNMSGNFSYTTDFYKPNSIFTNDGHRYGNNTVTLYNSWLNYLNDIYHKDSKSVEVDVLLNEKPRLAMRKFYFFDNAIWTLNKITNYSPFQDMQKCTFIKVSSINNYIL